MGDTKGYPCLSWAEEGEEEDDNEEEWRTCYTSPAKRNGASALSSSPAKKKLKMDSFCTPLTASCSPATPEPSSDVYASRHCHKRTIIHIDIDCFYAQVEMVLNPSLQTKPLGIQQKHIIVTCNYVARERGLTKLMRLSDAKKKCPDLVLVNGENLSKYRDFSKRINDLLLGITPNVERLGFDENFVDVTDLVEARLRENSGPSNLLPDGKVYAKKEVAQKKICTCGCHQRLTIGSQLAAQIRKKIFDDIGLTCCAGIAHNKLLAKLAGECNKPNKQTLLFPDLANMLLGSLPARKIPGIGSTSSKRLQSLGINSVPELQACTLSCLKAEFGDGLALTLKRLSHGIDDNDVIPSGAPKSMSEEDTYHQLSSLKEVTKNLQNLANNLIVRLTDDIGTPHTVRLTIRRGIGELAGDRKESRQGPIPSNFSSSKLTKDQQLSVLLSVTLELFKKLVNTRQPFNIKLLNICLTNFQKPTKCGGKAFNSFFTNVQTKTPAQGTCTEDSPKARSGAEHQYESDKAGRCITGMNHVGVKFPEYKIAQPFISLTSENNVRVSESLQHTSQSYINSTPKSNPSSRDQVMSEIHQIREGERGFKSCTSKEIPSDVDPEVFNSLPMDVQRELIEQSRKTTLSSRDQTTSENYKKSEAEKGHNSCFSQEIPSDVDHEVFNSLPMNVQRELIAQWKEGQKSPVRKKAKKQPTGLLKYFSKAL